MRIKIIGCGNPIAGDDGVGIHVINSLKTMSLPGYPTVLEGGTDPLNLLEMLRGTEKVILVDAVKGAGRPGDVCLLNIDRLDIHSPGGVSLHQWGLSHVLQLGNILFPQEMPKEIILIGVEVMDTAPYSTNISQPVKKAIPQVIKAILQELGETD